MYYDAFKKFITAGQIFISRGDDSGTNKKEIELWSGINFEPIGQSWYLESGQGMGATLNTRLGKISLHVDRPGDIPCPPGEPAIEHPL